MSSWKKVAAGTFLAVTVSMGGASAVSAKSDSGQSVSLTAEQESCIAAAKTSAKGLTGPARKATIKSAAQACGVWKRFNKLTAEQQACLAANGLKRPSGAPTKAHKKALRSLAAKCGVTLKVKG